MLIGGSELEPRRHPDAEPLTGFSKQQWWPLSVGNHWILMSHFLDTFNVSFWAFPYVPTYDIANVTAMRFKRDEGFN